MRERFVIVGDFNYPGIRWATGGSDAKGRAFYDSIEDIHMTQHVDEPTHISGNLLDLVLSSNDDIIRDVRMEGRLGTSDHELIETELFLDINSRHKTEHMRDYGRGDYVEMRRRVRSIDWVNELENLRVEEAWQFIKGKLSEVIEALVPMKRKRNARAPVWMDNEVKRAINEKKKAWKRWKRSKREEERREYKKWENKTKKIIRNKKNTLERQIAKDSKSNPKHFFSFVNSARRSRSAIGPLNKEGVRLTDPKDKAVYMNEYFSSVFTRVDIPPPTKDPSGMTKISDIEVNELKVIDAIDRLREFSAPGPGGITNKILIELRS